MHRIWDDLFFNWFSSNRWNGKKNFWEHFEHFGFLVIHRELFHWLIYLFIHWRNSELGFDHWESKWNEISIVDRRMKICPFLHISLKFYFSDILNITSNGKRAGWLKSINKLTKMLNIPIKTICAIFPQRLHQKIKWTKLVMRCK